MGPREKPGGIRVTVELRSGAVERFEISDEIYEHLAGLISDGLDGAELCHTWLPTPTLGDPPVRVSVLGTLADKTPVGVLFYCAAESAPEVEQPLRRASPGKSPD
jgi:hypothetical protein